MSMFGLIPEAHAQAAAQQAAGSGDMLQSFLPFIIIIGIFYFLLIRPQQQKAKQLRNQLAQLQRGDSVITAGGVIGTVYRVISDTEVTVEIADGVRVRVVRSTIVGITGKGEPRTDSGKTADNDAGVDKPPASSAPASTPQASRRRKPAAPAQGKR